MITNPYLVGPEKVKIFHRWILVNGENTQKRHFFFTGKLRKETYFLAFSWEKFLHGEIFVSTEVFR
jgi:hypothetical protein